MLLYGAVPITPFLWHSGWVDLCPLLWEWDRCTRTIIHFHTWPFTSLYTHVLHTEAEGAQPVNTTWQMSEGVAHTCNHVFRRFRGGDQATEDHHHGQTARDPQKCLQKLAEAGTPRQRAAVLWDGAGHESSAGTGFGLFIYSCRRLPVVSNLCKMLVFHYSKKTWSWFEHL